MLTAINRHRAFDPAPAPGPAPAAPDSRQYTPGAFAPGPEAAEAPPEGRLLTAES